MNLIISEKLPLNEKLANKLVSLIPSHLVDNSVILNFRDKSYKPETGGYHPVEISLHHVNTNHWRLCYITDFCFVGQGDFAELAKCLDFDVGQNIYQDLYHCTELIAGIEIFKLWQNNFMKYLHMGVFEVTVTKT